jgi:hypothetical protein
VEFGGALILKRVYFFHIRRTFFPAALERRRRDEVT